MKVYRSPEEFKIQYNWARTDTGVLYGVKEPSVRVARQVPVVSNQQLNDMIWSSYNLDQLPGCCGVVVSNGAYLNHNQRGYGLGEYFHKERIDLATYMGYSCMMATTILNNEAENHILRNNGWKTVHSFVNKRTGNTVLIWIKDI